MDVIELNDQRLRLRLRGRASTTICTFSRDAGTAEVTQSALGIRYRRKRTALSNIANVTVRRRTRRKVYRPVLEVRFGDAIPLGDYGKEAALEAARTIRDFLRLAR